MFEFLSLFCVGLQDQIMRMAGSRHGLILPCQCLSKSKGKTFKLSLLKILKDCFSDVVYRSPPTAKARTIISPRRSESSCFGRSKVTQYCHSGQRPLLFETISSISVSCLTTKSILLHDLSFNYAMLDLAAQGNRDLHKSTAVKLEEKIDSVIRIFGSAFRNDGQTCNFCLPFRYVTEPDHITTEENIFTTRKWYVVLVSIFSKFL